MAKKSKVGVRKKAAKKKKTVAKKKVAKKKVAKKKVAKKKTRYSQDPENNHEYARAVLYAKLYLPSVTIGDSLGDEAWRDVPILEDGSAEISFRELEGYSSFGIAVSDHYSRERFAKPNNKFKWFRLSGVRGTRWTRDILLSLGKRSNLVGTSEDWLFYEFSSDLDKKTKSATLVDLFSSRSPYDRFRYWNHSGQGRYHRPTFPNTHEFPQLCFDRKDLPQWANNGPWLVRKVVVSPLELDRNRKSLEVSTRHLAHYREWVIQQHENAGRTLSQEDKLSISLEIQQLIECMDQSKAYRSFNVNLLPETAQILGVENEWLPTKRRKGHRRD